jgi:hypothetical protein
MEIDPEDGQGDERKRKSKIAFLLIPVKQKEKNTREQEREHLGAHAPSRHRRQRAEEHHEPCEEWSRFGSIINKGKRGGDHSGECYDQERETACSKQRIDQRLGEPLMGNPLSACSGEGKNVCMRDAACLEYVLSGPQVPPEIGVRDFPRRHDKDRGEKDSDKEVAGRWKHDSREHQRMGPVKG